MFFPYPSQLNPTDVMIPPLLPHPHDLRGSSAMAVCAKVKRRPIKASGEGDHICFLRSAI